MHIIDLVQRSPEWQAWRAGGVTASEAAVILGRSPYQTPWRLWAEKTGLCAPADLSDNPFVQRGLQYEDTARQGFETRHQTWLLPVCAESARHPELRCSFDGLTDSGEPVELKVPAVKTWETLQREGEASLAFQLYWIQVQFQLFIAEADRGWLVFDPVQTGRVALEFVIARDEAFIAQELVPACLAFAEAVRTRQEPTPDPARDTYVPDGEARGRWAQLAAEYQAAEQRAGALDAALKEARSALNAAQEGLVALMGDYLLAEHAGLRLRRYQQRGSVDYNAALAALLPDLDPPCLEAYRRPGALRVRVTRQDAPEPSATSVAASAALSDTTARPKRPRRSGTAPSGAAPGPEETAPTAEVISGYF